MTEPGSDAPENAHVCETSLLEPFSRLLFVALEKGFLSTERAERLLAEPSPLNPLAGQTSSPESVSVWRGFVQELGKMDSDRWAAAKQFLNRELSRRGAARESRSHSERKTAPVVNPLVYYEKGIGNPHRFGDRQFNGVRLKNGVLNLFSRGEIEEIGGKVPIRVNQNFFVEFEMGGKSELLFHEYDRLQIWDRDDNIRKLEVGFEPKEVFAASNGNTAYLLASDERSELFFARYDGHTLEKDFAMPPTAVYGTFLTRSGELYVALTGGLLRRDQAGNYSMVDMKGIDVGRSVLFSEMPDGSIRILTTRPSGGKAFRLCYLFVHGDQVSVHDLKGALAGPMFDVKPLVYSGTEYFAIARLNGKLNLFDDQGNHLKEFPGEHKGNTLIWMTSPEGKNLLAHATQEKNSDDYQYSKVRIYDVWNPLSEGQKNAP